MNDTISYWNKTAKKTEYPRLENSIDVNVLIIGSGITGITCAYSLVQKGIIPVVIEAGGLIDGTTGNTTGKLTIQHGIIYSNILNKYGMDYAKLYAESQESAISFVRKCAADESIDCQLSNNTAYIYASTESDLAAIESEYETVQEMGIDSVFMRNPDFPNKSFGMLGFKNQAVFHPVRYVNALAEAAVSKGAKIFCGTKAVKITDGDIITVHCENDIVIKAKHLVMATQYPVYDGPNIFYTRLYAKRTYGIAVDAKNNWPEGSYINNGYPTRSIRSHTENGKRILIIVGDGHFTARGEDNMETHYENLIHFADKTAGVNEVLAKWSAQDYETPDQIPYIGRISDNSNIYVASGFGKWGLTNGTLAGNMISDLIESGVCRYEELYSRDRADFTSSMKKTVTEVAGSVGELIKSKFEGTISISEIKPGEGGVIKYKGQKAGIYRDFENNTTILDISCTHMSTELNYNSAERTWDCPAHGGRFNTDGKLLEGPPKNPLKVLYKGKFSDIAE